MNAHFTFDEIALAQLASKARRAAKIERCTNHRREARKPSNGPAMRRVDAARELRQCQHDGFGF